MGGSVDLSHLAGNLAAVRERVDAACLQAGREVGSVDILPVSKTFDAEVVRAGAALDWRRFGENRVQEIREKAIALADLAIDWVVIGPLQTNKAKDVARLASELQTLDRLELAEALDHRLQQEARSLDVLVQVKTSPEATKHGLAPAELPTLLQALRRFDTLHLRGLMTIATHTDDTSEVRRCFRELRQWRDRMVAEGHTLPRLSMGMSGDFALAIAEGATDIRIGSAIFGSRPGG